MHGSACVRACVHVEKDLTWCSVWERNNTHTHNPLLGLFPFQETEKKRGVSVR